MNPSFERHKLIRFIKSQGRTYTFTAPGTKLFGEPTGQKKTVEVSGVYHETQGYVTGYVVESSNLKSKPESLIMCLMEDTVELVRDMMVTIGDKDYRVVDLRDVNNLGVACDISLELVLK